MLGISRRLPCRVAARAQPSRALTLTITEYRARARKYLGAKISEIVAVHALPTLTER